MANGNHPIEGLMNVTLDKIRQMTDSNTIIGNPITVPDGTTILPISKVSFAFASGGSDFASSKTSKDLFGGGSSAGVTMQPVAFLIIKDGGVRLVQIADGNNAIDRAFNLVPEVFDAVAGLINKDKKSKQPEIDEELMQQAAEAQAKAEAEAQDKVK